MTARIDISTFTELVASARLTFVDGLTVGHPIGKTIVSILLTASAFGGDEADRGAHPVATTPIDTFAELKREATASAIEQLFGGTTLDAIVHNVCVIGMAFGHKSVSKKLEAAQV